MANHNSDRKRNIPMALACVLLCLTLISIHMTSGLYARYTTSASASASARVIGFGQLTITETGDFEEDGTMRIIPGVNLTKEAIVNFSGSEAATYVFVEVTLSDHWTMDDKGNFAIGTQMSWAVDSGWTYLDGSSYVYYRELAPNTVLEADIIAGDQIVVSELITQSELAKMTGITIDFRASAVQSNGFDSPSAAWASLSAK